MIISNFLGYVEDLFVEVIRNAMDHNYVHEPCIVPPSLCSGFEQPDKETAILEHQSRFLSQ